MNIKDWHPPKLQRARPFPLRNVDASTGARIIPVPTTIDKTFAQYDHEFTRCWTFDKFRRLLYQQARERTVPAQLYNYRRDRARMEFRPYSRSLVA